MEARTVNNLPPAGTHDDAIYRVLAMELSKKGWIVAVNTPLSDKISRHTLKPGDGKELLDLCERIRTRVARETKKRVEMVSCYEVGYDGFWLHCLLQAHDIRNHVIDPASLQVDRRARRAKTDRVDAERLLRSLMAYLRGEPKVWSVVRVPSVAEEDNRRLHRERGRLINERIQHVNRIKDCSRSMASMTTNLYAAIGYGGWDNYTPLMVWSDFAAAARGGNSARTAAVGDCHRNDQNDRGRARCHCIGQH
jgi:transposase